nr:DUF5615 family PIN-like protein [cf. Phormidesmis sp. LEGE 11477]
MLDENLLSAKLKKPLVDLGYETKNVEDMGWRGTKDTALLALASSHDFEVFITADKNLPHQQNIRSLAIKLVILNAVSTRPTCLVPLISRIGSQLHQLEVGSITTINDNQEITSFKPS